MPPCDRSISLDYPSFKKLGCSRLKVAQIYTGSPLGLHLVVVYLVVGQWRVPWSFRVWRGKGTDSPAQLGLKLVKCLPKKLTFALQGDDSRRYSQRQVWNLYRVSES